MKSSVDSLRQAESVPFAPPNIAVERRPDGSTILRSTLQIEKIARSVPHLLDEQAARTPDRPFIRQRKPNHGPWRELTYRQAATASRCVAQWLIDQGIAKGDAIAILSGPSIEHVIFAIGAQRAEIIAAPLSVNYSLLSQTHGKLRACVASISAKYAFVSDPEPFAPAIRSLFQDGISFIVHGDGPSDVPSVKLETLLATSATDAVEARMNEIAENTIARIMFTSGSSGTPKACAQTQGALMAAVAQVERLGFMVFSDGDAPQILESLPFSHIMAGSYNFNNALRAGATINLDEGKPVPQLFPITVANLREISPSYFVTAPLGLSMLADELEHDAQLRKTFFRDLRYMVFGGAMLPQNVRTRLIDMAFKETGRHIRLISNYGGTETGPVTSAYWDTPRTDVIGLPTPSTEIKLVPLDGKLELRVRGPSVMPGDGYFHNPVQSVAAFDEEGFFRTGDAARFADPNDPSSGLVFDGRFGEQFKLISGTWVSAGILRTELLAATDPLLREAIICCENRKAIGILAWLSEGAIRTRYPALGSASADELIRDETLCTALKEKIQNYNSKHNTQSQRVERFLLISEPLSFDANEVTDKGSANQRAVLQRRALDVERLFASRPDADVLVFQEQG